MDRVQFERIQDKAKRVAAMLPVYVAQGQVPFGVEAHHYRLNAPIARDELEAFEEQYAIALPEEYRQFLLEVGNGGAGPYYGVLPLSHWAHHVREWDHDADLPMPLVLHPRASYLASPSQLRPDVAYDENWQVELAPQDWDAFQGTLAVCNQGCADCTILIVSGEARGRVVTISEDWIPPEFLPVSGFLSWYEAWQDAVLTGRQRAGNFLMRNTGASPFNSV